MKEGGASAFMRCPIVIESTAPLCGAAFQRSPVHKEFCTGEEILKVALHRTNFFSSFLLAPAKAKVPESSC
jgi:hypothetical protein